jgi:DegV family protein with EDD domain
MQRVALVTDSTAGLAPSTANELGITVVPASFAFAEERTLDGTVPWESVYQRMAREKVAPRTFGVAESGFRDAFEAGLARFEAVFCLLAPFDVNPSFTTACAAMLAVQFDAPDARIKVANAGVGSAGLGALLISLAALVRDGAGVDDLVAAVDDLEPRCDSLFAAANPEWLERAGRLHLVEERLGPLDGGFPVIRLGTRITGVAIADDFEQALTLVADRVGSRAMGGPVNVQVLHADAAEAAEGLETRLRERYAVAKLEVGELPATHGAQLGPGTVGVGMCPAKEETDA